MNAYSLRLFRICGLGCFVALSTSGLIASDLVLQKVPPLTIEQAPAYPQNLMRHRLGAQIELASRTNSGGNVQADAKVLGDNTVETALLGDDPTIGYTLPIGQTTMLVSLSKIENVDSVSLLNDGVQGDLTIATANAKLPSESPQWHKISQQDLTSKSVKAKIGPVEAKYVRLTFNVTEAGRIGGLGIYPTAAVSDFTMPRTRKVTVGNKSDTFGLISYNLTDLHAKTRALYVSSGEDLKQANNMVDDQASTSYSFSASDGAPTTIIDLGTPMSLRRISAIYSPRQGTIDFYLLQTLPGIRATGSSVTEDAPSALRLNDAAQENLKPVGSVTNGTTGRAAVDFPATTGRYIMVKWNSAVQENASLSVAEIAAFGGGQSANLMAANSSASGGRLIDSDGKTILDGKEAKDFKPCEIPAEGPAEGPPLSLPQPPTFVFIPEVSP